MINLITTYYKTSDENRNNEINKCLIKNVENKNIKKIYLLNNNIYDFNFINDNNYKIKQVLISKEIDYKLKYKDAFIFINEYLKNEICILSNSDIYFNETLSLINDINIKNSVFALLRYDEDINGDLSILKKYNIPREDSQDSWIFKSPLNIDLNQLNFSMGTLGCDNVFANIIYENNIKITNPSLDIITIHVHLTNFRTYTEIDRIYGKYCMLEPCKLDEYKEVKIIDY